MLVWIATLVAMLVLAPAIGHASVVAQFDNEFPSPVTVGQTSVDAVLSMTNANDGADMGIPNTVCNAGDPAPCGAGVEFVPSCAQVTGNVCTIADPGVLDLSATGVGETGSACENTVFDLVDSGDSVGTINVVPQGAGHVTLGLNMVSECRLGLTFDVLRAPSVDASPAAGVQTAQILRGMQTSGGVAASAGDLGAVTIIGTVSPPVPPSPVNSGNLVGQVVVSAGAPAPKPGALVQACRTPPVGVPCLLASTDSAGGFAFNGIPTGIYRLRANPAAGDLTHTPGTESGIDVQPGLTIQRTITLGIAQSIPAGSAVRQRL